MSISIYGACHTNVAKIKKAIHDILAISHKYNEDALAVSICILHILHNVLLSLRKNLHQEAVIYSADRYS
jgi:Holliday junction resolvasome RuvABC endonuclease subunit